MESKKGISPDGRVIFVQGNFISQWRKPRR